MPGGKRTITLPPSYAYGAGGIPHLIPPHATLIYEITVEKVE